MKRNKQQQATSGTTIADTFRDYHMQVRRALNAAISAHSLPVDINNIIAAACSCFDAGCNYEAGAPEPSLDERLGDVEAKITALVDNATAASEVVAKVRPFLRLYPIAPPPSAAPSEAAVGKQVVEKPSKQHRKEQGASHVEGVPAAVLSAPPSVTPRQFQPRPAPRASYAPRPSRSVIIVNLPSEFNTQPSITNLIQFHTHKVMRVMLPGFPDATSAFVRLPTPQDGYNLIALGGRLVDGYPTIVARPPSAAEVTEANEKICAPVREVETLARAAMVVVEKRYEAAAGAVTSTPVATPPSVATAAELAKARSSYQTFKKELELLAALGPVADAARKLEVLTEIKRLLETIKRLDAQFTQEKAVEAEGPIAAPVTPTPAVPQLTKRFSSSAAAVGDPSAVLYVGPFNEPLHDDLLLALLGPLPLIPKRIWRRQDTNDICIEASSAAEVAYLLDHFLFVTWGKFCDYTFSRRPIAVSAASAATTAANGGGAANDEDGGGAGEQAAQAAE